MATNQYGISMIKIDTEISNGNLISAQQVEYPLQMRRLASPIVSSGDNQKPTLIQYLAKQSPTLIPYPAKQSPTLKPSPPKLPMPLLNVNDADDVFESYYRIFDV
uniref:Uncharacterized protein n=1 Tax=Strigamia maritima TaxID=126957 RepID=T1J8A4_STRMM